ncbi:MAG: class I SAM-dependent DNA methyltransferase [Promethearchaeota archaeon]
MDPDRVIELLQRLVESISLDVQSSEKDIFRSILAGNEEIDEALLPSIGAYLLVNQLLFYRVLAESYPELEPLNTEELGTIGEIKTRFEQVLNDIGYEPIFSFDVISTIKSLDSVKHAIKTIDGLKPEKMKQDFMGKVFHRLIPLEIRKKLASYYTKTSSAKLLANIAIQQATEKVIDPACGSGTLLVASYHAKRKLTSKFSQKMHNQFLSKEITGIDVMAFSAHLCAINLALQAPLYETKLVRVAIKDSTVISSSTIISPISKHFPAIFGKQLTLQEFLEGEGNNRRVETGTVSVGKERYNWKVGTFDVVIMNPPFTRKQTLIQFGEDYRRSLIQRFEGDYPNLISSNSPFYQFFLLIADRLLNTPGRIAAVLPTTVLRAEDAISIRTWIKKNYQIRHIIIRMDRSNFSEDTAFREILFIADKETKDTNKNLVKISFIKNLNERTVDTLVAKISNPENVSQTFDSVKIRTIKQEKLDPNNFFKVVALYSRKLEELWSDLSQTDLLKKLDPERGDGRVKIRAKGTPTPTGISFEKVAINSPSSPSSALRGDNWILESIKDSKIQIRHRKSNIVLNLEKSAFISHFRRCPYKNKLDVSDLDEYVVREPSGTGIGEFLKLSEIKQIDWDKWQTFLDKGTSYLGFVDRLDISAPGSSLLSWYSDNPRTWARIPSSIGGISKIESKLLCLWFNSTINIIQYLYERNETRGAYIQLHKYIIEDFLVPKFELVEQRSQEIENLFHEIGSIEFPSLIEQFILLTKGLDEEFRDNLDRYYPGMSNQLGQDFKPRKKIDSFFGEIFELKWNWDEIYELVLVELLILRRLLEKDS